MLSAAAPRPNAFQRGLPRRLASKLLLVQVCGVGGPMARREGRKGATALQTGPGRHEALPLNTPPFMPPRDLLIAGPAQDWALPPGAAMPGTAPKLPPMCIPPAQALIDSEAAALGGGGAAAIGIGPGWPALQSASPPLRGGGG